VKGLVALALVAFAAPQARADEDDPKPPAATPAEPAVEDPKAPATPTPPAQPENPYPPGSEKPAAETPPVEKPVPKPVPKTPAARPGHPVTTVTLQDGTTVTGEVVGINARWVVIDTGAKVVTIRRAEVTSLGDGIPPSMETPAAPPAFSAPSVRSYPTVTKTREPPRDRIHQGAFFAFGILPRFLSMEACTYAIGTNCIQTASDSGYAVAGTIEFGYAFRKRFLLALVTVLGGGSVAGHSSLLWDEFLVARAFVMNGLFLELGAGMALTSERAGFGGRIGFGYEVKVARNFTFTPALTATGMIGPSTTGRVTVDGQIAVRYYF
jgi:hypothetical protein